uniref:peroxidase n=1 Tax=Cajanus cajan TaxID=3821 RepID=A0A151T0G0_CAJCA|nr:Cationic peroxidase 2 [Cajanus cajan]
MHFHDCFVQGCDGSVLIAGSGTEKTAFANLGLRGYEVIDDAKTQLEAACPGVVSCADILALAARDSVVLSGGLSWPVPTGRRDGRISQASDVNNLPAPFDSVDVQKQKFAAKGLNTQDLVTLVGAHTIGTTACQFFSNRLYNFTANGPDPSIDASFLPQLQALCPQNSGATNRVALDTGSQNKFDTSYYNNLRNGRGILQSDQALWNDDSTKKVVQNYLGLIRGLLGLKFNVEFGKSMVKMSNIELKTGSDGEILATGSRDGRISKASDVNDFPSPFDSIQVLKQKFAAKGLNTQDLVTLLAAHTIGTSACQFFSNRLYNFSGKGSDPSIDPSFLLKLIALCLSDQALWNDESTNTVVRKYLGLRGVFGLIFNVEFGISMVKMGNIDLHPLVCLLLALAIVNTVHGQGTRVGFYSSACPRAEFIVRSTVQSHVRSDPTLAAGLLRMHFHDCFVQGCDASVLIAGAGTERTAFANLGLRGYEVIDDAKTQLEAACPGVVSCADILALAARDSVVLSGGLSWQVPTGRRDGRISQASDVNNLPAPFDSVDVQKQKFSAKGLNTQDLVTLVGGHTIGTTACQFFSNRLYNFTANGPDSSINPSFLPQLRALCPQNSGASNRVALDTGSQNRFDASYFANLRNGRGILQSDQALWNDASTKTFVQRYVVLKGLVFNVEFGRSMVKMSNIELKTGTDGEIRKICSAIN